MAQRVSRNAIPRVNPNPRPPNEPKPRVANAQPVGARAGIGNNRVAPNPVGNSRAVSTPNSGGGSSATSPPPAAVASTPTLAPPTDPRDARYWQDLAQLEFNKNIGEQKLNTEDVFDSSRHTREKANLDYLAPIEVQHLRENANTAGAIYSTATQEGLGNLGQEQFQRQSSLDEAFQQALSSRALSRNEISGNFNLGKSNVGLEATERAAAAERERAAIEREIARESAPVDTGGGGSETPSSPQQAALQARATKNKPQPAKAFGAKLKAGKR